MKTLDTFKQELLMDKDTTAAYADMAGEFSVIHEIVAARAKAGLSQSEVAQRMGTTQSAVARLESGKRLPSMRTVERFAQAVGGRLVLRIELRAQLIPA